MSTRKAVKRATAVEIIKINRCLEEVIIRKPNNMCSYKKSHNDHTVADTLGVGSASVANVRKQMFGNLLSKTTQQSQSNMATAHDFNALINRLADFTSLINRLQDVDFYVPTSYWDDLLIEEDEKEEEEEEEEI